MRKILLLAVAFSFVGFLCLDATAGTVSSKWDASIGGYVKLDYIHQDAALGPLSGPVKADGTPASETQQSILTARQSRIHLKVSGGEVLGAKMIGFVEGDFYGPGGSNSSGNFRMRHATGTLAWKDTQFMFGQFWDIFAPGAASTVDFNTGGNFGVPNNPRVAQARLTHNIHFNDSNWLTLIGGVQDPVQNANPGFETSGVNVAGQAMFNSKALGVSPGYWGIPMQPLIAGVFGIWGQEKISGNQDEKRNIYGYGFYTHVPVLRSSDGKSRAMTLSFEGQTYVSAGLKAGGLAANSQATVLEQQRRPGPRQRLRRLGSAHVLSDRPPRFRRWLLGVETFSMPMTTRARQSNTTQGPTPTSPTTSARASGWPLNMSAWKPNTWRNRLVPPTTKGRRTASRSRPCTSSRMIG